MVKAKEQHKKIKFKSVVGMNIGRSLAYLEAFKKAVLVFHI